MICVKFIDGSELHIDEPWEETKKNLRQMNKPATMYVLFGRQGKDQAAMMIDNILWIKEIVK